MSQRKIELTPDEVAEVVARRERIAKVEDQAETSQTVIGGVCTMVGLGMGVWVVQDPTIIGAIMAAGAFITGIIVAVPAARPWMIRIIERLPWTKDLPDDWEGE